MKYGEMQTEKLNKVLEDLREKDIKNMLKADKKGVEKVIFTKGRGENTPIVINFVKKEYTLTFMLNSEKQLLEIRKGQTSISSYFEMSKLKEYQQVALLEMFNEYVERYNLKLKLLLS